jgi:hypothetical protein
MIDVMKIDEDQRVNKRTPIWAMPDDSSPKPAILEVGYSRKKKKKKKESETIPLRLILKKYQADSTPLSHL